MLRCPKNQGMIWPRLTALVVTALLGCTAYADAACGRGQTPTYSDIEGLRFVRTDCFGTCPSYEVLISPFGLYYVGRKYVDKTGTYQASLGNTVTLAKEILQKHDFYRLNYDDSGLITDVPHFILAVERCGVTTKLDWPDYGNRPDIQTLFNALDTIIRNKAWHKTSDSTDSPLSLFATIP